MKNRNNRVLVVAKTTSSTSSQTNRPVLGFVLRVGPKFGFIQINSKETLFFPANAVEPPLTILHLRHGDPVEVEVGRNHQGRAATRVRRMFALRAA